jgi:hypothetical protein
MEYRMGYHKKRISLAVSQLVLLLLDLRIHLLLTLLLSLAKVRLTVVLTGASTADVYAQMRSWRPV